MTVIIAKNNLFSIYLYTFYFFIINFLYLFKGKMNDSRHFGGYKKGLATSLINF